MFFDRFLDKKYVKWAKEVKERDNFTCQVCFKQDTFLNSHHMNSWDFFLEERYVLKNGVTLCSSCHDRFHEIYGRGQNTRFQFQQFKEMVQLLRQLALKQIKNKVEPSDTIRCRKYDQA